MRVMRSQNKSCNEITFYRGPKSIPHVVKALFLVRNECKLLGGYFIKKYQLTVFFCPASHIILPIYG